jgi:hypothetical protein
VHPLLDEIRRIDLGGTTPMGAMKLLEQWQEKLRPGSPST